jgi:hypothetical protein
MNWVDDINDYPLSYTLSYYTLSESQMITLKAKNEGSFVSSSLSQGLSR